jgi:hypothetical protein
VKRSHAYKDYPVTAPLPSNRRNKEFFEAPT